MEGWIVFGIVIGIVMLAMAGIGSGGEMPKLRTHSVFTGF